MKKPRFCGAWLWLSINLFVGAYSSKLGFVAYKFKADLVAVVVRCMDRINPWTLVPRKLFEAEALWLRVF